MTSTLTLTAHETDPWRLVRLARLQAALEQCTELGLLRLHRISGLHDHKGTLRVTLADVVSEHERWLVQALWLRTASEPVTEFVEAATGRYVA